MPRRIVREVLAPAAGLAAWLLYILACTFSNTAFSPDGSRVAFSVIDPGTPDSFVIVGCTRAPEGCRVLLRSEDDAFVRAAWSPDGRDVVAVNEDGNVLVLPIEATRPPRLWRLRGSHILSDVPPVIVGTGLLFSGEQRIELLDTHTGDLRSSGAEEGELRAYTDEGTIVYSRSSRFTCEHGQVSIEFGVVDPARLTLAPRFQTGCMDHEFEDSMRPKGNRVAALADDEETGMRLVIFDARGVQREIPFGRDLRAVELRWSPDGSHIYAGYSAAVDAAHGEAGLLDIAIADGTIRRTPLFTARLLEPGAFVYPPGLDLSPDGATIAIAPSNGQALDDGVDRDPGGELAVYFIDLTRPERPVTKMAVAESPDTPGRPRGAR